MDIFLSIPEELSKQLFVEWLEIFHVAKLDSAYLSHNSRAIFLGLVASSHSSRATFLGLIADPYSEFEHGSELDFSSMNDNVLYLTWLARRECRVRNVCIFVADDSEHLHAFFQICGSSLSEIEVRLYGSKRDSACGSIIAYITEHCHHLQQLTLTGRFPESPNLLHQLSLRCPYINKLVFQDCGGYKGDRNKDLSFHALRAFESSDTLLSDNFLAAVATCSTHLEELRLDGAYNVSVCGYDAVAANCPLLQRLQLSYMNIEDAHVLPIVRSCKNLHAIGILQSDDFTDASLTAIAMNCLKLRTLYLEGCCGITDKGLDKVLRSCSELRELNLSGTTFLTDDTLCAASKWRSFNKLVMTMFAASSAYELMEIVSDDES